MQPIVTEPNGPPDAPLLPERVNLVSPEVDPLCVILLGSRATGQARPDSDAILTVGA